MNFILKYGLLYTSKKEIPEDRPKARISETIGIWAVLQSEIQLIIRLWRALEASKNNIMPSYRLLTAAGLTFDEKPFEIKNYNSLSSKKRYPNFKYLEQKGHKFVPDLGGAAPTDEQIHGFASEAFKNKINNLLRLAGPTITFESNRFTRGKKGIVSLMAGSVPTTVVKHSTLFSALLYQLLDSINKQQEYKKCLECLSWMEVSKKGRDGNKYCCAACRNKASRRRRDIELIFAAWPGAIENFEKFFTKIGEAIKSLRAGEKVDIGEVVKQISINSLGDHSDTLHGLSNDLLISYFEHLRELVAENASRQHFGLNNLGKSDVFEDIFKKNLETSFSSKGFNVSYYDWSFTGYDE